MTLAWSSLLRMNLDVDNFPRFCVRPALPKAVFRTVVIFWSAHAGTQRDGRWFIKVPGVTTTPLTVQVSRCLYSNFDMVLLKTVIRTVIER